MSGARAGAIAMAALALTPLYYGHSFNNPKDIPFAALHAWALCAIIRSARELPGVSLKRAALTAGAIGLMLGVRLGGVFVFGCLFLFWIAALARKWGEASPPRPADLARAAATLVAVCVGREQDDLASAGGVRPFTVNLHVLELKDRSRTRRVATSFRACHAMGDESSSEKAAPCGCWIPPEPRCLA